MRYNKLLIGGNIMCFNHQYNPNPARQIVCILSVRIIIGMELDRIVLLIDLISRCFLDRHFVFCCGSRIWKMSKLRNDGEEDGKNNTCAWHDKDNVFANDKIRYIQYFEM